MAKAKKDSGGGGVRAPRATHPGRAALLRRVGVHAGAAVLVVAACAVSLGFLRRHVERRLAFPSRPPAVVLKARPAWMSDLVARQVAAQVAPRGPHSAFDHTMLVEVTRALRTNPWIREVRGVRRVYGKAPGDTLEIDCDFRTPAALVRAGDCYYLIDRGGVRLPEQYAAADVPRVVETPDGRTNILIIEGVARRAPRGAGQRWAGHDLRAGLDMAALLLDPANRAFTQEIQGINVENFTGRRRAREAHLVLFTKYGTEIRWGRPHDDPGFEIDPARKLDYLRRVYEQYGRVDGNQPYGIDIRYDKITYPSADPRTAGADTAEQ